MALSSVGTVGTINTNTATAASFTWVPGAVGNAMFLWVRLPSTSNTVTSVSSTNATWTQVKSFNGTTNSNKVYLYQGVASSTSSATVSLVLAGAPGTNTIRSGRQEFHSSVGAVPVATVTSTLDSAGTNTWPTVAATGLYAGWAYNSNTGVNGSTSGFTYQLDSNSNSLAYDLSATSSSQPTFGDSTQAIGIMTIIVEGVSVVKGTPDQVSATSGVASSTTSISPPAGSLVRWSVAWLNSNDTLGLTFTAADSHGTSYGAPTLVPTSGPGDGDGGCYLMIWDHLYSSAPGATTLTVTAAGSGVSSAAPSAMLILPYTITGQSSSPEGAFNSFNEVGTPTTTYEIAITPESIGSAVFVLAAPNYDGGAVGAVTPLATTVTDDDWQDATVGSRGTLGSGVTLVTATTSTTYGWTSANASPFGYGVMAAEILPAGASSIITSTVAMQFNPAMSATVTVANPITSTVAMSFNPAMSASVTSIGSNVAMGFNPAMAASVTVASPVTSTVAMNFLPAMSATVTSTGSVVSMSLNAAIAANVTVGNPVTSTVAVGFNPAMAATVHQGNVAAVAMSFRPAIASSVSNSTTRTAYFMASSQAGTDEYGNSYIAGALTPALWIPATTGVPPTPASGYILYASSSHLFALDDTGTSHQLV